MLADLRPGRYKNGMSLEDEYLRRLVHDDPLERLKRDAGLSARSDLSLLLAQQTALPLNLEAIKAASGAHSAISEMAKSYGGIDAMMRSFKEQKLQADSLIDAMGGIASIRESQAQHWAAAVAAIDIRSLASLTAGYATIASELELTKAKAFELSPISVSPDLLALPAVMGLPTQVLAALETTSLKMSVLAGITDVRGVDTFAYAEALRGLMGNWHTSPDLPRSFWTDRRVRERRYRKAEVDPGLIVVPPPAAVEILVESGYAGGASDETGAVAFFSFGGVSVSIRSNDAEQDAYRAIRAFERGMRVFISAKLQGLAGLKWFKQRVSAEHFKKASETREAALRAGETGGPLIDYTELGELMGIVLRKDNWDELFEPVFVNRETFERDMLTLITLRRPTAHSRIVDSPQLIEALCVMKRLDDRMKNDGAWTVAAAADE
jgi:hypothetical protein